MKKIISNIGEIPVGVNDNNVLYFADGIVYGSSRYPDNRYINYIENDDFVFLEFNKVITTIDEDTVVFDKHTTLKLSYSKKYKELSIAYSEGENGLNKFIRFIKDFSSRDSFTKNNVRKFIFAMLSREAFFDKFVDKIDVSNISYFYSKITNLYLFKNINVLEFYIKFDLIEQIYEFFEEDNNKLLCEIQEINKPILYKFIKLKGKDVDIKTLASANKFFNNNEFELLFKFVELMFKYNKDISYSYSFKRLLEVLIDIKLLTNDFTRALDTITKELFKNFRLDELNEVLNEYKDYLNMLYIMKDEETNRYPNNIEVSHAECIYKFNIFNEEKEHAENCEQLLRFKASTNKYKYLEYKNDNYIIMLPNVPSDLINEGDKLNHCVGSYIDYVTSGKSTILFVRKSDNVDTPYMTLEVRDDMIVQAKKDRDKYPNKDDKKLLEEFCEKKSLTIRSF